jgi:hypothetical protein
MFPIKIIIWQLKVKRIFRHAQRSYCWFYLAIIWRNISIYIYILLGPYHISFIFPSYLYIWVNSNISLIWNKAILGWFPSLTLNPLRENSEVVIIYPDRGTICLMRYCHQTFFWHNIRIYTEIDKKSVWHCIIIKYHQPSNHIIMIVQTCLNLKKPL